MRKPLVLGLSILFVDQPSISLETDNCEQVKGLETITDILAFLAVSGKETIYIKEMINCKSSLNL